jgi:phosphoserine aminotransferase
MRVINFNAGPAGLPLPALERARDELIDFNKSGMSIMEHSHRGAVYEAVHDECIALFTELLGIPSSHQVVFVQGGATMQFALVPMNFLPKGKSADYVVTGVWSEKAIAEAKSVGTARAAWEPADKKFIRVPQKDELKLDPNAAFVHTTSNNTIYGTQFHTLPDTGSVPHICDMSSDFMWRPTDISKFAFVYAGAQKNIGPSGLVVLIANKDFLKAARTDIPKVLRYETYAEANSLYNTPNTFGIYLARNVLSWMKSLGGLTALEARNKKKGELIYGTLDTLSAFYKAPVEKASRSVMNIVFRLPSEALEDKFVADAKKAGMVGLKGHRSAGGIRVSAYNAVSVEDVQTLVQFMESFAKANG